MPLLRIPEGGLNIDGITFAAGEVDVWDAYQLRALVTLGAEMLHDGGVSRADPPEHPPAPAAAPELPGNPLSLADLQRVNEMEGRNARPLPTPSAKAFDLEPDDLEPDDAEAPPPSGEPEQETFALPSRPGRKE